MNQDERNNMIEEYGGGFDLFAATLDEVPRKIWEFKPKPHEWSVHEIIIHLADAEAMGAIRARKLIAEPGTTLMAYDEAGWAESLDYQNQSVDDALQIFKLTKQMTYRLLKSLPDQVFTHTVVHPEAIYPEYGEAYTLEKWLHIYTRHVRDHIKQMKDNYTAWNILNK
jgi:hypothetical protein